MNIKVEKLYKRFSDRYIIKDLNIDIKSGARLAIQGLNGSGKSTFIQLLAGLLSPSKGKIIYTLNDKEIHRDDIFKHLSYCAPYMELDEEFTIQEYYAHYSMFKKLPFDKVSNFMELVDLKPHKDKKVAAFSSGMKQRLMLGLTVCTDVPFLLLDEPTSFLDKERKAWFIELLKTYGKGKTIVIASNDAYDLQLCDSELRMG